MRYNHTVSLMLLLAFGLPRSSDALERPIVQVRFSINEPLYIEQLEDHEREALETTVESKLLSRLNEELPFLHYSSESSRFIVDITLGKKKASKITSHVVHFYFSLIASNEAQAAARWEFRSQATWDSSIVSPTAFGTEIATSLRQNRFSSLVHGFLERVPVAQEGETIRLPEYPIAWVLPFKQNDLCIAAKSRVRLTTEIETSFNPREARDYMAEITVYTRPKKKEHQDRILCLPEDGQNLDLVKDHPPEKVRVRQVFIVFYVRLSKCKPPAPPAAVFPVLSRRRPRGFL